MHGILWQMSAANLRHINIFLNEWNFVKYIFVRTMLGKRLFVHLSICLFVCWLVGWLLSHKSPRRITICKILLKIAESLLCLGWNSNSKWNPIYGPKMHNQLSRFDCHILTVEKIIDSKNPFLNVNVLLLSSLRG